MTKAKIILFIAIVAYTIYFSWATISRHFYGFSGRYDLGNMEQTVWNTSEGRIFQMTNPDTSEISSRLAFHADFLLILMAPIYKLLPDTATLLVVQALIVALGAVPVFLIAKKIFSDPPIGGSRNPAKAGFPTFFAIFYLFSPVIQRANIFEFHSEVLGATFLLFTFYFLLVEKTKPFLLFFLLALISKETVSLTLAMICFWGIVKNKKRTLCALLFVGCVAYFLFMVRVAIPTANGVTGRHFALRHFTEGDEKFFDIIAGYIKYPLGFIINIVDGSALQYYSRVLSYGGFLFLLSPLTFLFSLPTMLINVLANGAQFTSLNYQYSATIVPGLIISAIYCTHFLFVSFLRKQESYISKKDSRRSLPRTAMRGWNDKEQHILKAKQFGKLAILLICLILTFYNLRLFSPLPFIGQKPYLDFLRYQNPAAAKIRAWAAKIPSDKSVSVTNNVGSHFATRQNLYEFPMKIGDADYVVIAAKSWQEWVTDEKRDKIIIELKGNPNYKLLDETKEFWIFEKQINADQ